MNPSDLATGFKDFAQLQIALEWQPSALVPLIRYMEYKLMKFRSCATKNINDVSNFQ